VEDIIMSEFLKIGHRGAAGYEPENTLRSFIAAIKMGADAIEFDVRLSADKKVVVFHDATLSRITGNEGLVCDVPYNTLRLLNAGKGEQIPLLEQVFGVLGKGNATGWKTPFFNIELKEDGMIDEVLRLIRQYNLVDSVVISAFDANENGTGNTASWGELIRMSALEPSLRIAFIARRAENFLREMEVIRVCGFKPYALNPSKNIVTEHMVAKAHAFGVKVFVWTVNEPDEIIHVKAMGVDGIFSDYPDRL
jgi:glycerophosphoryl diester phosphodiesterase